MGSLTITIPMKINRSFRVRDAKAAKRLVEELEKVGEGSGPFDDVFGIWADRPEDSKELTDRLRAKNNRRNG